MCVFPCIILSNVSYFIEIISTFLKDNHRADNNYKSIFLSTREKYSTLLHFKCHSFIFYEQPTSNNKVRHVTQAMYRLLFIFDIFLFAINKILVILVKGD